MDWDRRCFRARVDPICLAGPIRLDGPFGQVFWLIDRRFGTIEQSRIPVPMEPAHKIRSTRLLL